MLLDTALRVTVMNPAAENLLGFSRIRAIGLPFDRIVDNDRAFIDVLKEALENGVSFAYETRLVAEHGPSADRLLDCRISCMDNDDGRYLLVEMTDVTRRVRISRENALLIQHGAGRRMVRQLAHEIKNPLGGLRGAAQLLGKQLDSDELKEYTDVIISEADRLAGLVDTLLGPGGPPNKTSVNVHELIEYVLRLVEPELEESVYIRREYDPGLPNLDLDRDQIVQALLNLVRNAMAAIDGAGNLIIRTRPAHNFTIGDTLYPVVTTIEIEDDGPGIPIELQESVFYPLVTSRPEGTGLGLPAAQELLSRHGGMIEFDSRPGRTVFLVRIPLTEDPI